MTAITPTARNHRTLRWALPTAYFLSFALAPFFLAVHAWVGTVAIGPIAALIVVFYWQLDRMHRLIFGLMIMPLFVLVTLFASLIVHFGFHHPVALFQ